VKPSKRNNAYNGLLTKGDPFGTSEACKSGYFFLKTLLYIDIVPIYLRFTPEDLKSRWWVGIVKRRMGRGNSPSQKR
jgi:hypothetical protein